MGTWGSSLRAWEQRKLGELILDYVEHAASDEALPVMTSSRQGLQFQEDHFGRLQQHDISDWNVIPRGYCTYRNRSDDRAFTFNVNKIADRGLVSKFYPVFGLKGANADFLVSYLNNSPSITRELSTLSVGTSQVVLALSVLKNLELAVPSRSEQQAIGELIDSLDNLITLHLREPPTWLTLLSHEARERTHD